mgnify:FL=1
MRFLNKGLIALVVCAATSCSTWQERFDAMQADSHDELAMLYPVGGRFDTDADRFFGAFERWDLKATPPSEFAAFLRGRVRQSHGSAVACWHGEVPRLTLGSSLGAMGIWADYVFVDVDGRVLVALRRFID